MGRPVGADQSRPVDGEAHRQVLHRDVVHDLVVGALQEGRIERAERLEALRREPGREGDGVLLGDADVEHPLGKGLRHEVDAGALRHGGGDGDDPLVGARGREQRLAEHLGVGGRVALGLRLRPGDHVEGRDAVVLSSACSAGR